MVDEVISVILTADFFDPIKQHLLILFEGRPSTPSGVVDNDDDTEADTSVQDDSDEDATMSPTSPSPATANEHLVHFYRRYYIACGVVFAESVVEVRALLSLSLHKDQRPTHMLHLPESGKLVVWGTAGLLGSVDCKGDAEGLIFPVFASFTEDSTVPGSQVTHAIESAVTAVDYSYRSGCIASGDSSGSVCLWRMHIHPHRQQTRSSSVAALQMPPMHIGARIAMVRFVSSGEAVVVATTSALLLLGVHTSQLHLTQNLYVRRVIDE